MFEEVTNEKIRADQLIEAEFCPNDIRLKRIANGQCQTECRELNRLSLQLNPKDLFFENSFQGSDIRLFPVVLAAPELNQAAKRADEKHTGATCRIKNLLVGGNQLVRKSEIQQQTRDERRRKHRPFSTLRKSLVKVAQDFDRDVFERKLTPEVALLFDRFCLDQISKRSQCGSC